MAKKIETTTVETMARSAAAMDTASAGLVVTQGAPGAPIRSIQRAGAVGVSGSLNDLVSLDHKRLFAATKCCA